MTPRIEVTTVTPAMATEWLESNTDNYRKVRQPTVARYAEDMAVGAWLMTGESIKFNREGVLMDGQHRLLACVKADTAFETVVVYDLETPATMNIDNGLRRQLSDHLRRLGEINVTGLAATIGVAWRFERDLNLGTTSPTFTEAMTWLAANPDVRAAVVSAEHLRRTARLPVPTTATVLHYARQKATDEDVDEFIRQLQSGANLAEDSGTFALRRWASNREQTLQHVERSKALAIIIKGWNAYITGTPVRNLVWRRGGVAREVFPKLLGPDD